MVLICACSKVDPDTPKQYFTLWNSCEALTALQDWFLKDGQAAFAE